MNTFSLIYALILAVLFTILLLLFIESVERKAPQMPPEPERTVQVRISPSA